MNNVELIKHKFRDQGSALVKNLISKEMCDYLTRVFLRVDHIFKINNQVNQDSQVSGALISMYSNPYNDTLLEMLWPVAEKYVGEDLIPTYTFCRLYCNGNVLNPHVDRPSCEISLTIQLGKSHDYIWPIYAEGTQYDLDVGDAMIYQGCERTHWRNPCQGPEGYYSGQLFLHYVKANGQYKQFAGDQRWKEEIPFLRDRIKHTKE